MTKNKLAIINTVLWILTFSFMLYIINILKVDATELKSIDFNNIESRECKNEISDIILDILKHDEASLQTKSQYFTNDCFYDVLQYTKNNKVESTVIPELVVDYTTPSNSSTGDTVIMANTKVYYKSYNKLYLFEFHVNQDGKIYGYNIWVY